MDILIHYNTHSKPINSTFGKQIYKYELGLNEPGYIIYDDEHTVVQRKGNDLCLYVGNVLNIANVDLMNMTPLEMNKLLLGGFLVVRVTNGVVEVITDAMANIPAFIYKHGDEILISSRVDWILKSIDRSWSVEWDQFKTFSYSRLMLKNKTLIKDVTILNYASVYKLSNKTCTIRRYWDPKIGTSNNIVDEFTDTLISVVDRTFKYVSNPVLSLSAGYDSRLLLAAMLHLGYKPTIGSWGSWNTKRLWYDNKYPMDIAKSLGLEFVRVSQDNIHKSLDKDDILTKYSNGFVKHSYYFMIHYKHELARLGFDVDLTGVGAGLFKPLMCKGDMYKNMNGLKREYNKHGNKWFDSLIKPYLDDVPKNINHPGVIDHLRFNFNSYGQWWPRVSFICRESVRTNLIYRNIDLMDLSCRVPRSVRDNNNLFKLSIKKLYPKLLDWKFNCDIHKLRSGAVRTSFCDSSLSKIFNERVSSNESIICGKYSSYKSKHGINHKTKCKSVFSYNGCLEYISNLISEGIKFDGKM